MLAFLLTSAALAVRPTEGGPYAFDPSDTVLSLDDPTGRVRVHYSADGPNLAKDDDDDGNGLPDFAEDVAARAAEVLAFYEDDLGLLPPVAEGEIGPADLGGSDAFDFYLVDFGGDADGYFGVDACDATRCSGFMVMENDFRGYGYPSLSEAVSVLTSHELFHGVQGAYSADQPVWFSEGTAVWAEQQFHPGVRDFLYFADEYLLDAGRSLDRPPTGPVPAFAYGTGLFWDFLTLRHDPALMREILEGTADAPADTLGAVEIALGGREDALAEAWTEFVAWNLATGPRAGIAPSYPYAADLEGIVAEDEVGFLDDTPRLYPLAATYWRLDHPGGELAFALDAAHPDLRLALHPVASGDDGPVSPALATWDGAETSRSLGDLPEGGYWLAATYPFPAAESLRPRLCLGSPDEVEACAPADTDDADTDSGEPEGCGCASASAPISLAPFLAAALLIRRRRPRLY